MEVCRLHRTINIDRLERHHNDFSHRAVGHEEFPALMQLQCKGLCLLTLWRSPFLPAHHTMQCTLDWHNHIMARKLDRIYLSRKLGKQTDKQVFIIVYSVIYETILSKLFSWKLEKALDKHWLDSNRDLKS